MAETSLVAVRAAVFYYDPPVNSWRPADDGVSRVDLYANNAAQTYRVVAISAKSNDVVINSPLFKDLKYQRASSMFHQWSDARFAYGLNFASVEEAESFASAIESTTAKLSAQLLSLFESHLPIAAVYSAPAPQHRNSESRGRLSFLRKDDEAEDSSSQPSTPEQRRLPNGELADEAQRVKTGERPMSGSAKPMASTGSLRLGSASKSDLETLKTELVTAFRREVDAMKREVLEAVSRGRDIPPPPSPPPGAATVSRQSLILPPPGPPPPL